ncbi:hypothetical protein ACGFNP_30675 [Nonomuraea sp. NPDC049269]|uniref:hypothetical protein n=1 Tax=Nonomuraea sp. NPDC049269 TaxID=3364349 RepID=UPI003722DDA7
MSGVPDSVSAEQAVREGWYPEEEAEKFQQIGAAVAGDKPAPEMARLALLDAYDRWGESPSLSRPAALSAGPNGWQPQHYLRMHLLGGNVPAFEIRSGCVGMISSLDLAASLFRVKMQPRWP